MAVLDTSSLKLSFTCMLQLNILVLFSERQTKWGKKLEQCVGFLRSGGSKFWIV